VTANRHPPTIPALFRDTLKRLTTEFGVRGLERLVGINKATISRAHRGSIPDLGTAQALGSVVGVCPCCGRVWPPRSLKKPAMSKGVEDLISRLPTVYLDEDGLALAGDNAGAGELRALFDAIPPAPVGRKVVAFVPREQAASALSSLSLRVEELEAEVHNFRTWGIIEVAIRNPSVADYMRHWERRAENAEAELTRLRTAAVDNDSVRGREGE
jgi:hypothetical protein